MKEQETYYKPHRCWYEEKSYDTLCNGCYKTSNGIHWYVNGKHHREDGPACEYTNEMKSWYLNDRVVYTDTFNDLSKYDNLSESFRMSIIKYELSK
jgi:hypothetical protein